MSKSKMKKISVPANREKLVIAKYIRVSTDKQREEGYSIDIQKERLSAYTESMYPRTEHIVSYREYIDDGYSGGSLERPQITQLIEDVKNGEITHVVVVKLDRLSRSQKDTLYLIEDVFLPNNVAFVSMGESFNTETPFGRAVVGILSVFAQLERENIYERTRSGMQKRVELGFWPGGGGTPFGYDYDRNSGTLIPNKDADTVRMCYDLYIQGYSEQSIANMLNLKYEKLAHQILIRKSNTGVIVYNGNEYPGKHEAIISLETYNKAMELMAQRSYKQFRSGEYLLTGLLVCGCCGAKMRYQKWGKDKWKVVCYSQYKSKPYLVKDPNCPNSKLLASDIEETVMDMVFRRVTDNVLDGDDESEDAYSVVDLLAKRKDELEKKLKRLYMLFADDDNDVLVGTISDVKEEIESVTKKLSKEQKSLERGLHFAGEEIALETLKDCWPHMTAGEKQNVLRSLINEIKVTHEHIHIDFLN